MKAAAALLPILALLSFVSARAETDAQAETWPSPDGKIVIAQPVFRGPILFIDAATQKTLYTQKSSAKTMAVTWSTDSLWVAFYEYFNPHSGGSAFHVYSVAGKLPRLIQMPDGLLADREGWSFEPQRWLPGGRLVLEGEEQRINETKEGPQGYRWDLYRFIIRCRRDGSSMLLSKHYLSTRDQ